MNLNNIQTQKELTDRLFNEVKESYEKMRAEHRTFIPWKLIAEQTMNRFNDYVQSIDEKEKASFMLKMPRVEKEELERLAEDSGMTMTRYILNKLFRNS